VARATGGIQEIIEDYDPSTDSGYGFLCYEYSTEAFWDAIKRTRDLFRDPEKWGTLMARAMARNFSWEVAVERYEAIYAGILGQSLPMQLTA
jgi:starch synthase